MANMGSMPLEHPAIMLNVPVGAIVVRVAFLNLSEPGLLSTLFTKFGKTPFSSASFAEAISASLEIKYSRKIFLSNR